MHLKTWFIFQMEKHCFQRPLLGSCQFPRLPFPRKLVCKWGLGMWRSSLSGTFWNQRLAVLSRQGRATFCISSYLQTPGEQMGRREVREDARTLSPYRPFHTPSSATGNAEQWPFNHLETSPRKQKPWVLIFGFYSEIPLDRFCGIDGLKFARIMLDLQLNNFVIIGFILTKAP